MNLEQNLNELLSDLNVFYRKLQNYHWNVTGQDFFQAHSKLEELYNEINEQIDEVAEHILILGEEPLGTLKDYLEKTNITEAENKKIKSQEVFQTILKDYKKLLEKVTEIKEKADEQKEYSTSALMDDYILDYSKIIWMLKQKEE
ncbi:MAG: DNA starvation/stationary phase protection protein [Clostridium sp. 26_22]|nr:MAG: DNA starvation/stationary phase protection protein [Clostridium sp. 26_22]